MAKSICSVADCGRPVHGRGWCLTHYRRWQRHGDAGVTLIQRHDGTAEERFWAKVDKTGDCWVWTASVVDNGWGRYGKFYADGKFILAHRFSFQIASGWAPPEDIQIDHRCHNTLCVRPDHLRLATPSQNRQNYHPGSTRGMSGVRGVDWCEARGLWRARVQLDGKCVYWQLFQRLEDAEAAVIESRIRYHTFNDADRSA